ncbi:hypothetical protein WAI453_008188 [Rhynchosporium graminicola]
MLSNRAQRRYQDEKRSTAVPSTPLIRVSTPALPAPSLQHGPRQQLGPRQQISPRQQIGPRQLAPRHLTPQSTTPLLPNQLKLTKFWLFTRFLDDVGDEIRKKIWHFAVQDIDARTVILQPYA